MIRILKALFSCGIVALFSTPIFADGVVQGPGQAVQGPGQVGQVGQVGQMPPTQQGGQAVQQGACTAQAMEDADHDGIPNAWDLCAKTPANLVVWRTGPYMGCAGGETMTGFDTDNDGVIDAFDLCAHTHPRRAINTSTEWLGCSSGQFRTQMPITCTSGSDAR